MARRTKIVCTMGPATSKEGMLDNLLNAGMNMARMNFSHGSHDDHRSMFNKLRETSIKNNKPLAILGDLQGPKIRLGKFKDDKTIWKNGETIVITTDEIEGTHDRVSTTYKDLPNDAFPGNRILVDDGKIALEVLSVTKTDVTCKVIEGGPVSNNKGINLPGMKVSAPVLTEKDRKDLEFGIELGVDYIALSFVRSPKDIEVVHEVMDKMGKRIPIIAKIEKPEAVEFLEEIVLAFDGIMVARGDLGVELPLEDVPVVQKRAIQLARKNAKPVIVATQMLESMIQNSRPTRAEANDVANAVFDGTDAVMLSGETAVGAFPVDAVTIMSNIAESAEKGGIVIPKLASTPKTKRGVLSLAGVEIAERLNADAIIVVTQSGDTLRRISRLHSERQLIAYTPYENVKNQLSLSWGTDARVSPFLKDTDSLFEHIDKDLILNSNLGEGDMVVIVAGSPPSVEGGTNFVRVHKIGELVN